MQYQTFPDTTGGSDSLKKLLALNMPDCKGKRYLDIGCNEGYFCGYAASQDALEVIGIDISAEYISRARKRFPDIDFRQQSWERLPRGKFDIITLLSALHYAEDQEELIHNLMSHLTDDGVLILEIGIAPGGKEKWVDVERSIDERRFPSRGMLRKILEPYAWKIMGYSVMQPGDPLSRYVVHVRKMKPYVYLLMGEPGSGKTTICRKMFDETGMPIISGDRLYYQIAHGKYEVSPGLFKFVKNNYSNVDIDKLTRLLCKNGMMKEMVSIWKSLSKGGDFVVDSYVPNEFQNDICAYFEQQGCFPVSLQSGITRIGLSKRARKALAENYNSYLSFSDNHVKKPRINVISLVDASHHNNIRCHIDSPAHGQWLGDSGLCQLSGWIVDIDQEITIPKLYLENASDRQEVIVDKVRKDVVDFVFGSEISLSELRKNLPNGFNCRLSSDFFQNGAKLVMINEGAYIPLVHFEVKNKIYSQVFNKSRYTGLICKIDSVKNKILRKFK